MNHLGKCCCFLAFFFFLGSTVQSVAAEPSNSPKPILPAFSSPPMDSVMADPSLAPGSITVELVDGMGSPLSTQQVELQIRQQSITHEAQNRSLVVTTDSLGHTRFDHLNFQQEYAYRVVVHLGQTLHGVPFFQLDERHGRHVILHIYPLTSRLSEAMVAIQGTIFVEPQDDIFAFELMFNLFNLGRTTWIPEDVGVALPHSYRGFSNSPLEPDLHFQADPRGAKLVGTVTPGKHSASFSFQLPNPNISDFTLNLGLLPNIAELQVAAALPPEASLSIPGFPSAKPSRLQNQQPILFTGKSYEHEKSPPRILQLELHKLPTLGPGRYVALGIAGLFVVNSLVFALILHRRKFNETKDQTLFTEAEKVLTTELLRLEQSPKGSAREELKSETARQALFEALVRLEAVLGPSVPSSRGSLSE